MFFGTKIKIQTKAPKKAIEHVFFQVIYAYCECDVAAIIVHTKDNKELLLGLECPNVALEKDISYFIHACRFAMRSFYSASSRLKQGRARPLETLAFRLKKKEF